MAYRGWVLVHIVGVTAFLSSHGASMFVLYRIRRETDRKKITDLIAFSGETAMPMYVSLVLLTASGVVAGVLGRWFSYWWIWAAIGVLLATTGIMTAVAKPYFKRIGAACAVRPTGVPLISDEELSQLLMSGRAHAITAIGAVGLLAILYLMIFKPGVG